MPPTRRNVWLWRWVRQVSSKTVLPEKRPSSPLAQRLRSLRKKGSWKEAIELWQDADEDLEAAACAEVLGAMARAGAVEAAQLLRRMHRNSMEPDELGIGRAIAACVAGGAWEEAIKLLMEVEIWRCKPNAIAYNSALGACGRARSAETALELLKRMDRQQISRTARTYGAVIGACGRGHSWESAIGLLEEMRSAGGADAVAHAAAVSACARAIAWRQALALFRPEVYAWLSEPMAPPAFTVAVAACDRASLWQEALGVYNDMQQRDVVPSLSCFNSALSACSRCSEWQQALQVWVQRPVPHDLVSSGLLIRAMERAGQWSLGLEMFEKESELGTVAFTAAISCGAMARQWQTAMQLLQRMQREEVPMTRSTRNAVLRSFDSPDLLPQALQALQILRSGPRNAAQTEEWRRQEVPGHLELTPEGLDHAAVQLEQRLSGDSVPSASDVPPGHVRGSLAVPCALAALHELPLPEELVSEILTPEEVDNIRAELQHLAIMALRDTKVVAHVVGSRLYGAALRDADIDLVLERHEDPNHDLNVDAMRRDSVSALIKLRRLLESESQWHVEDMALNARRPTLRLRKAGLDAAVEVTFDQTLATLLKSDVLARATRQSPSHHLVLLLIRCWAARRGLCGQRRGFPSGYAFGLMVANHWQSLGMLPLSPRSRESLSAWGGAQAAPVEPLNMEDVDRHMVAELFSAFFRPALG